MRTPHPHSHTSSTRPLDNAPLHELQRRAAQLRAAVSIERDLRRLVDRFLTDLMGEAGLFEHSVSATDATLLAVVGEQVLLGSRYPHERFDKALMYGSALGLFHGALRSSRRSGCMFQFVGESQGVVALWPYSRGQRSDFFRYTAALPTSPGIHGTMWSKGGSA